MLLALVAYAVLAGADFGGGVWDIAARGARRDAQRRAVARALGPVWEANHVWLIFAVVLLFGCFPRAFAALSIALFAPLHLALVGITLRGVAFVFRAYGPQEARALRVYGAVFGGASVVTPVLLGQCLGAVAGGRLRLAGLTVPEGSRGAWLAPFSWLVGAFALASCAYLAAVYLTLETTGPLREDFRRRALASGTVLVALSVVAPWLTRREAPLLGHALLSPRSLPVLCLGGAVALLSGLGLWRRWYRLARASSIAWVALLLAGLGLAMYPSLIVPDLDLHDAAAPAVTLRGVLWTIPPGLALLLPSLGFLFKVFKSNLEVIHEGSNGHL
ncbi:MAG: cytochrome d ubiquinol oxidase subunit II [Deltaproteobacteria bacterium]|nr:cytochrome d ubiquinol oxidase subunit II [Deltaproteobacteria bacterium]